MDLEALNLKLRYGEGKGQINFLLHSNEIDFQEDSFSDEDLQELIKVKNKVSLID